MGSKPSFGGSESASASRPPPAPNGPDALCPSGTLMLRTSPHYRPLARESLVKRSGGHRRGFREAQICAKDRKRMENRQASFSYEELLACGRGEMFPDGPQLPLPPM